MAAEFCLRVSLSRVLSLMMEAVRTSETSVDNHFTRQYNPEDSSEHAVKSYDMGPTALLPLPRQLCYGFSSPLKIHRPRSGGIYVRVIS
jgi:hypothetical protein